MKRYSEYKDSGVKWVGEIPKHWDKKKLGYSVNLQGRIGFKGYKKSDFVDEGEGCRVIGGKHIDKNNKISFSNPDFLNWDKYYESPEIMVKKGDLIVSQRGTLGKVLFIDKDYGELTINPSLVLVNQLKENPKFLWYYLQSDVILTIINLVSSGAAIPMISQEQISNFPLITPSLPEQQKIVTYLDHKTQKIDELIEIKEKKIALLKEKRTALINHVVTKGLDPDVEMQDSGVEWIGEIPKHWEICPLKYNVSTNLETLSDKTLPEYKLEYIEISDVNSNGEIKTTTSYIYKDSPSRCRRILRKGDVFVSTVRTYLRAIGFVEKDVKDLICSTGFCVLTPNSNLTPKFLYYLINTEWFISNVIAESVGVSYPAITSNKLIDIKSVFPPIHEQKMIVSFLERNFIKIDESIKLEQKKVHVLKEYRQALISEVVTGKRRVCEEDHSK